MRVYNNLIIIKRMQGPRIPYNDTLSRRRKIEIISNQKVEPFRRHYYNQVNPYALSKNPSTPLLLKHAPNRDAYSSRQSATETSSQKSVKLVRTNGLSKADKPNLMGSKVQTPAHRLSGSRAQLLARTPEPQPQPILSPSHHEHHQSSTTRSTLVSQLQQQNSHLRLDNIRLKEQMLQMEVRHSEEVGAVRLQLDRLIRQVRDLEDRINEDEQQFETYKAGR